MNVAETLDRACGVIEMLGWRQGNDVGGTTVCAHQAINRACRATESHEYAFAMAAVGRALAVDWNYKNGWDASIIWEWNDTPGRTKEEVLAMFRAVAATERARLAEDACATV